MGKPSVDWLDVLPLRVIVCTLNTIRVLLILSIVGILAWAGLDITAVMKRLATKSMEFDKSQRFDTTVVPKLNWKFLKGIVQILFIDEVRRTAVRGRRAPNLPVFDSETLEKRRLLDFSRPDIPLVVLLGSCTCVVFVTTARSKLRPIMEKYKDKAEFVVVYQEEPHATDGFWPHKGNEFQIATHKSLEERKSAAIMLKEILPCRILLDGMDNQVSIQYSGLPQRIVVIFNGYVQYISTPKGPRGFNVDEISRIIDEISKS